ncbi:MAG TPA: hypothetical protein VFG23_23700 [Polyangia bacterium]|nr:hypothetical protein [Polyangia bacterium]
MPAANAVGMHRHLTNLLPTLLACAPSLFALGMLVLGLASALPRLALARLDGRR